MGKFDDKIKEQTAILENKQRYEAFKSPIVSFQWDTGYAVMYQSRFLKMNKRDKNKLLEPLSKQARSNVQSL